MRGVPAFHVNLPSRRRGSFGRSRAAEVAEQLTLTWFRFEVAIIWFLMLSMILFGPVSSVAVATWQTLLSPFAALTFWAGLKLAGWVIYFIPKINVVWGWGRILFLMVFSRLVVERAPGLEIPAWISRR